MSMSRANRESTEAILVALPLFAPLGADELARLAAGCALRAWERGSALLREGDPARGMFVVLRGVVKVVRLSPDGRESVLHLVRHGQTLGEAAMFQQGLFPATALAVDDVRALYLEADALFGMIRENPDLALRLLAALSMRLRMFSHKLAARGQGVASRRLAAYLVHRLRLGGPPRPGEQPVVRPGVSREVLANLLGLARETLSRQLSRLEEQGLVARQGRDIVVLDEAALRAWAESGQ